MTIRRAIGQITDLAELRRIEAACRERRRLLDQRAWEQRCQEKWEAIKALPLGTELHVCAEGKFFSGPFQRGDSMQLVAIKRSRRAWVKTPAGKTYWLDSAGLARYDLRPAPPADPMPTEERQRVEEMGRRLQGLSR